MLSKALKFFTSNSIFLALNGALVVVFADFLYGDQIPVELLIAAFLTTFSVYGVNKITDRREDEINRPESKSTGTMFYLAPSIAAMFASLAIGITVGVSAFLILAMPLIIGFAYNFRIIKSMPRLKEIVGVKSIVVALSWAITGTFLPITMQSTAITKIILVFIYIFTQIFVNTVIFDGLDMMGDLVAGVKTIPIAFGRKKTGKLLSIINGSLIIWIFYCLISGVFVNFIPAIAFGVIYGYVIIWRFFRENCQRLHAELMVDGEWLPMVCLIRVLLR